MLIGNPIWNQTWSQPAGTTGYLLGTFDFSGATIAGITGGGGIGSVTNIATGPGLTGGPINNTGTVSVAPAGIVNSMLANPSLTLTANSGLTGGGTIALGGTTTVAIAPAGVTNAMLSNNSVSVTPAAGGTSG